MILPVAHRVAKGSIGMGLTQRLNTLRNVFHAVIPSEARNLSWLSVKERTIPKRKTRLGSPWAFAVIGMTTALFFRKL
jgi:hypothetical protein